MFAQQRVGTVIHPCNLNCDTISPKYSSVTVCFPSRLGAMSLDSDKITYSQDMIFPAGQILFSIKWYIKAQVDIVNGENDILINKNAKRKTIIRHAALITQKALGVNHSLNINVDNQHEKRHYGLGSSGALIGAIASCINELYGCPIANDKAS